MAYQADPIRESVNWLGRKWTLLVLRDMAFLKLTRFGQILRNNPGLTPRVLARRLRQMQQEGLVERVVTNEKVAYRLTSRGEHGIHPPRVPSLWNAASHVVAGGSEDSPRILRMSWIEGWMAEEGRPLTTSAGTCIRSG